MEKDSNEFDNFISKKTQNDINYTEWQTKTGFETDSDEHEADIRSYGMTREMTHEKGDQYERNPVLKRKISKQVAFKWSAVFRFH